VLDIGCGWGGFARYAAEQYGCKVTAVKISEEQISFSRERCQGLPVEIRREDYRQIRGQFDKIVSVGMFEHVGQKNYRTFMEVAHRSLKTGGIFLLHTIGGNVSHISCDPWINRYIFPNGMLPSIAQIGKAAAGLFASHLRLRDIRQSSWDRGKQSCLVPSTSSPSARRFLREYSGRH